MIVSGCDLTSNACDVRPQGGNRTSLIVVEYSHVLSKFSARRLLERLTLVCSRDMMTMWGISAFKPPATFPRFLSLVTPALLGMLGLPSMLFSYVCPSPFASSDIFGFDSVLQL
jgi:hypothetical protein